MVAAVVMPMMMVMLIVAIMFAVTTLRPCLPAAVAVFAAVGVSAGGLLRFVYICARQHRPGATVVALAGAGTADRGQGPRGHRTPHPKPDRSQDHGQY